MKILIVDDSQDSVDVLAMVLSRAGYEVVTACDVGSGRARLREGGFGALICDLSLPDGSGESILEGGAPLPEVRIVVSGSDSASDRQHTSLAGFQLHLAKPVSIEQLIHALRQLHESGDAQQGP